MDMPDNGVTHILCGMKQDDVGLLCGTRGGTQLKANELLISGILHVLFSN